MSRRLTPVSYTHLITDGERLLEKLPALFVNYQPSISLLHGDLWCGNAGLDESGKLALYDPAVYYGDRETDLAMAELFGGFPACLLYTSRCV